MDGLHSDPCTWDNDIYRFRNQTHTSVSEAVPGTWCSHTKLSQRQHHTRDTCTGSRLACSGSVDCQHSRSWDIDSNLECCHSYEKVDQYSMIIYLDSIFY